MRTSTALSDISSNIICKQTPPRSFQTKSNSVTVNPPSLSLDEAQRQHDLVSLLVGDEIVKGSLLSATSWYTWFLRSKFTSIWHLLVEALVGLDSTSTTPRPGDLVIVYEFFIRVVQLLRARENLALVEIVDELDSNDILKRQLDQERAIPNQVVFAAIGWLSEYCV